MNAVVATAAVESPSYRHTISVDPDLERLRAILLGKEYKELLALKQQLGSPKQHSEKVAAIVSEALAIRAAQDDSLSTILAPTVEDALSNSIKRDPQRLADALYPVMGPAIRKSINEVLTHTFDTFNQLLEQSLSPKSLLWRFDAWRSGRDYAEVVLLNTLEYQVEQVFLIHAKTGLLLRHVVSADASSKDPDMVSGMLTAIQDFLADSFEVNSDETLKNMRLGALNVVVEQGPFAVIAAVVKGNVPARLPGLLKETQENIHRQMHHALQAYTGDSKPFSVIQPLLENCLLNRAQAEKPNKASAKWPLYLLLTLGLAGILYYGYQTHNEAHIIEQAAQVEALHEKEWQRLLAVFSAEPGMVILSAQRIGKQRVIRGLLDPQARKPQALLESFAKSHAMQQGTETVFDFKPYLSGQPFRIKH